MSKEKKHDMIRKKQKIEYSTTNKCSRSIERKRLLEKREEYGTW